MTLSRKISNNNFYAFLWHAGFLAFAQNFMDVDTVIPAMLIESGGKAVHIGIMTAILMGGSSFTQLFFAPYISNKTYKKKYLLLGINLRVLSLFALGLILFYLKVDQSTLILWLIFLFITIFAISGAFSNISYIDILGKSVHAERRKTFFSAKQIIAGSVILFSAILASKVLIAFGYPVNFAVMFFMGGSLLLIASGGFWKVKEPSPSVLKINGFKKFIQILKVELSENPRLAYLLGFINTQGIIISFLPFVMLYAKETLNTQSDDTGYFLLFKVIGVVSVSTIVFFIARKIKYNLLLYLNVSLSLLLILSTLLIYNEYALRYIFIMGGVIFSLYSITMNGLLLEVSGRENRAIYAGFAGAGNLLPAILPLAGGWIIAQYGFRTFFLLFMIIVLSSVYFIKKIDCKK
ncbi:MAG: MFS transporter [Calditrichaceae bacterium]|nr:MFS transporter [Calditrichaceae bacterium]MBN2707602.1 MFS transporter [Calditrichaceae bacterium]RQV93221.1 MAG: MFS transporter [Calditrichota bacterium]